MPDSATLVDAIAPSDITSTKRREPAQLFAELSVRIQSAKYAAGRIVFRQGDPADAVFLIGHGSLHRAIMTERGDDRLVAILGPGDFCGEDCLIHKQYRMTTAIVVADAEVIRIEKNLMEKLRLNCPRLADAFTSFLLTHSLETEAALIDQFVGSAEQRLGRVLLKLANVGDNDREPGVVLNVRDACWTRGDYSAPHKPLFDEVSPPRPDRLWRCTRSRRHQSEPASQTGLLP